MTKRKRQVLLIGILPCLLYLVMAVLLPNNPLQLGHSISDLIDNRLILAFIPLPFVLMVIFDFEVNWLTNKELPERAKKSELPWLIIVYSISYLIDSILILNGIVLKSFMNSIFFGGLCLHMGNYFPLKRFGEWDRFAPSIVYTSEILWRKYFKTRGILDFSFGILFILCAVFNLYQNRDLFIILMFSLIILRVFGLYLYIHFISKKITSV